ncbi:MAG: hypothetical protein R3F35_01650 [Myxococcota bacterium]
MTQFGRSLQLILASDDGDGIDIGDLSVDFTVTKTAGRALNRARIKVFNLSRDTIARIDRELRRVDLLAGYGDSLGMAFSGRISNFFVRQEGPDRICEIYAQDGLRDAQYARVNASLSGGTLRDVVSLIALSFRDVSVDLDAVPDTPLGPGGGIYSKPSFDVLNDLARTHGFEWFIVDGQLRIFGPNDTDGSDAIGVNYETGLIGSPISSRNALEFTALLNPALRPLGLVEVTSATGVEVRENEEALAALDVSGVLFGLNGGLFRISEVTHLGETRGESWYSNVICHPFVGIQPNA